MANIDKRFISLCFDAVAQPSKWKRVLEHMMQMTGSPAAMITLRDASTCQIVDDQALIDQFHSPLICGFREEAVKYYLGSLSTIDPWAEAQTSNRPYRPVLMSNICMAEDLYDVL